MYVLTAKDLKKLQDWIKEQNKLKNTDMKTLEKIQNRLENENGLDNLLANLAGVKDYYTEEYNEAANGGFDFDLMYDFDEDCFFEM